jgi:hypothetical protein
MALAVEAVLDRLGKLAPPPVADREDREERGSGLESPENGYSVVAAAEAVGGGSAAAAVTAGADGEPIILVVPLSQVQTGSVVVAVEVEGEGVNRGAAPAS